MPIRWEKKHTLSSTKYNQHKRSGRTIQNVYWTERIVKYEPKNHLKLNQKKFDWKLRWLWRRRQHSAVANATTRKEWNTEKSAHTQQALRCVRYVCEWVSGSLTDWMTQPNESEGERKTEREKREGGGEGETFLLTYEFIHTHTRTQTHAHAYLYIHSISRTSAELTMNLFSFYVFKTYTHRPSGFITHWNNFVCKLNEKQQEQHSAEQSKVRKTKMAGRLEQENQLWQLLLFSLLWSKKEAKYVDDVYMCVCVCVWASKQATE